MNESPQSTPEPSSQPDFLAQTIIENHQLKEENERLRAVIFDLARMLTGKL